MLKVIITFFIYYLSCTGTVSHFQQIEFAVIGDLGDDNNGEEDVPELVNG